MRNRYTAIVQRDGKWFIAFCPEVPEANGQGKTREECLESLSAAIELVLEYRREQFLEKAPRRPNKPPFSCDETSRLAGPRLPTGA
jgi:predicted RNase H-like HicB family nuclease